LSFIGKKTKLQAVLVYTTKEKAGDIQERFPHAESVKPDTSAATLRSLEDVNPQGNYRILVA
jgi:hypothetical protein